jgi:putative membrane protein
MPTAVNGQLYYSQDEVQAGLPQYHAALRQATGYAGQFSADPTQKFQQYISGATPEQQAASNALSNIYGSGSFAPGTTTVVQSNQAQQPPDLSPIQTGITGLGTGQQGLMTGQQNLETGITGLGTGQQGLQTGITGLETGQQGLMTGITGLETGQQGLMTGQENIQTGITDLGIGQQGILGGQQALGAGQGAIQGSIGAPAQGQPQTLFSGQAGLMGGQQALGQQLTGGIQDITGAVGGVSQNIDALERAAEQYQREAQRQRAQIQTAGMTGREQIARQVADVGQQVNTGVEQQHKLRSLMGGLAAPIAAMGATAGVQPGGATQAATQYAKTQKFTPPAQGQQTIMGPMGPMTIDPRDQVTRPISSSGLMNYPV